MQRRSTSDRLAIQNQFLLLNIILPFQTIVHSLYVLICVDLGWLSKYKINPSSDNAESKLLYEKSKMIIQMKINVLDSLSPCQWMLHIQNNHNCKTGKIDEIKPKIWTSFGRKNQISVKVRAISDTS